MADQSVRNGTQANSSNGAVTASASTSTHRQDEDRFFVHLDQAANTVRSFLQEDGRWSDLSDHLSAAQYQYKLQLISPWAPMERKRVWSIPDAVIEASSSAETFASQGLFTEIERAWIVIDSRLYLWNYLDASQSAFESYEHPERVIHSVGLVRPKAGVFIDSIKHVLVICTSASISLLGLSLEDGPSSGSTSTNTNNTANTNAPSTSTSSTANGSATRPSSTTKQLKLFVTEMSTTTDGVQMSDVCGTDAGRIFCKGNDGCLYEILYQANEGWFSNRCALRNVTNPRLTNLVPSFIQGKQKESLDFVTVDSARNAVYTLHKGSEIEVHHLPTKDASKPPVKVARAKDICRHANMMCPNTSLLQPNEFQITWMRPVLARESRTIHLVAVTSKGVRLYFTTQRTGWRALSGYSGVGTSSSDPTTPTCLELIYVRPPPPAGQTQSAEGGLLLMQAQQQSQQQMASATLSSINFAPHQPSIQGVHHAYYADGIFLAACQYSLEPTGTIDNILCTTRAIPSTDHARSTANLSSSTPLASSGASSGGATDLADTATDVLIEGATWAIAEVARPARVYEQADERIHPLARQMIQPPRVFLVLTSSGLFVLAEQRPIDTLKGLLQTATLYDQTVHEFFKRYGQAQSCAMSLAIASQNTLLSMAPESFVSSSGPTTGTVQVISKDVVSHAWRIFFDFGGYPRYEPPPYPSQPASDGKVTLSGRHDGLAIYLARLLRPFWTQRITKKQVLPGEGERQMPTLAAADLVKSQTELRSLQTFLEQNAQLFGLGGAGANVASSSREVLHRSTTASTSPEGEQFAMRAEQQSFDALKALLSRTLEALSFVLLLIDYRLPTLVQRCKPEVQGQLANLTFADLIGTRQGRDVARALVEAVIDMQIASQVNIDVVADVLQERCGSFCNPDDVRLYKAMECIRRAKEAHRSHDLTTKEEALREALRLLNRATANLPLDKLESICEDFRQLHFFHGAVELPLTCAADWDRAGVSRQYRAEGMPANDPRAQTYEATMRCYSIVLRALETVDDACKAEEVLKAREAGRMDLVERVEEQRAATYAEVQASSDPLFHVAMYDWLLASDKTDELLQVRSPYVEAYLRSEPITLERCLLLCMWYVSVGHSFSAAQLYAGLAQSTELDITLDQRVEYLTKASSNAKSTQQNNSPDLIQFIGEMDEKLEVASVQIEIYKAVQESQEIDDEQKVSLLALLNESLLDITSLYREFAEPLAMHEIKLLIYHVSDYRDVDLARQAWEALLAEAHNDPHALPDTRHEKVASVVVELGHRFHPSDVAFPIDVLTEMLERYAYEQSMSDRSSSIPVGWAGRTILMANVAPQPMFEVLLGLFDARHEPFQGDGARLFLVADIAHVARLWIEEILGTAQPALGIRDALLNFSARRFDDALSALLFAVSQMAHTTKSIDPSAEGRSVDKVTASLKWTQELVRRSF